LTLFVRVYKRIHVPNLTIKSTQCEKGQLSYIIVRLKLTSTDGKGTANNRAIIFRANNKTATPLFDDMTSNHAQHSAPATDNNKQPKRTHHAGRPGGQCPSVPRPATPPNRTRPSERQSGWAAENRPSRQPCYFWRTLD